MTLRQSTGRKYLESNNLQEVLAVQQEIIQLYKKDIAKYDPANKLYIEEIFNLIPPELNAKNKRFILKRLNENAKYARYENSFLWLKNAGVAIPVYNVEEPKAPLLLARSRNLLKLFLNGRLPGKMPPVKMIAEWAKKKLRVDDRSKMSVGFVIARKIAASGTKAKHFFSEAVEKVSKTIKDDLKNLITKAERKV